MWKQPTMKQLKTNKFLLTWNLAAFVVFLIPLLTFTVAQTGNNDDEQDNDENNGENDDGNDQQQSRWWQFWKSGTEYNEDEEQHSQDQANSPWWWMWGNNRNEEEDGQGSLLFVYLWTLLLLGVITFYGNRVVADGRKDRAKDLVWALVGFINVCFLCCVLVGGLGVAEIDGREIEETGWYGQQSVLVFMTSLLCIVHCLVFLVWIYRNGVTWLDEKQEDPNADFSYHLDKQNNSTIIKPKIELQPTKPSATAAVPV